MAEINYLLLKPKQSDKICPIHQEHLVSLGKSGLACKSCMAEKIEQEKHQLVAQFKSDSVKQMLKHDSLLDKPEDLEMTFSTWKATKNSPEAVVGNLAYKIAQTYIRKSDDPIKSIFYGKCGEGKTHLAMAILNQVNSKSQQRCLFVDINQLFTKIFDGFKNTKQLWNRSYALKKLTSVDLLVLDDLGSESAMKLDATEATEFKQQFFKELFDRQKRIIITTNLALDDLYKVYNPKLVSRMLEFTKGRRVDFSAIKDKRLLS